MSSDEESAEPASGVGPAQTDEAPITAESLRSSRMRSDTRGPAWTPPSIEELAALLPEYQIDALLGQGGMGAVYKGRQPALERPVAIKLLPTEIAANERFLKRFRAEARTLARLQHPGIVAIYNFGQTPAGHLYFVMEFVEGTDLHQVIRGAELSPAQALEITSQVCDALHFAHRKGVIHRDIKPANILIDIDGRAKLADFGLARPLDEASSVVTGTNFVMGSKDYLAPEQQDGQQVDQRADIYALGVTLYEMLTGQCPHGAFDLPSRRVQVDVRLDEVVVRALQRDPERRYQLVSEMKTAVDHIRTKSHPAQPSPAPIRRAPRRKMMILAVTLVLLGGLAAFLMLRDGRMVPTLSRVTEKEIVHDAFFRDLIAAGATTQADLDSLHHFGEIKGTFVAVSKEPLVWHEALALAKRVGGSVLETRKPSGPSEGEWLDMLRRHLKGRLKSGNWLQQDGQSRQFDAGKIVSAGDLNTPRPVLIQWMPLPPFQQMKPVATSVPASWKQDGMVARIRGRGSMKFERIPLSSYVLKFEMLIREPMGHIDLKTGELPHGPGATIALGAMWPQDRKQHLIPCRLFRRQTNGGVNWWSENHFTPDSRLRLELIVADDCKALRLNGRVVLKAWGYATDLNLIIEANETADAELYSCAWRPLAPEDLEGTGFSMPQYQLTLDSAPVEERFIAQTAKLGSHAPKMGESFVLPARSLAMLWVAPGEFTMGNTLAKHDAHGKGSERVRLSEGFWLGAYEITQGQWSAVMETNPSRITGSPWLPVNWVARSDAAAFCERLTERERAAGRCPEGYVYRLPTEAEWEYACRAGAPPPDSDRFPNSTRETGVAQLMPIGSFQANEWGFHDMLGNVAELCLDEWKPLFSAKNDPTIDRYHPGRIDDPRCRFALRGIGVWRDDGRLSATDRSLTPNAANGFHGFRVALARDLQP